jgi:hypothetical protein
MVEEKTELNEMSREIRKIISENKKFLDRIMDEEFEQDEESYEEAGTVVEL